MYEIATNERHPERDVGYPYLINFNNQKEMEKIPKEFIGKFEKIDSRSIDCKQLETCIKIFQSLWVQGVSNLDLGAFSINPIFYKVKHPREYFDLKESYQKACSILEELEKKHGWSWETIGRYHSGRVSLNEAYVNKIKMRQQGEEGVN
jgi:hypothetical protein